MMLYLTNVPAAAALGAAASPGWCAATAAQVAWCLSVLGLRLALTLTLTLTLTLP